MNDKFTKPWQLIIEAKVGGQELGDITLDDVGFRAGCVVADDQTLPQGTTPQPTPAPCPNGEFYCGDGNCIDGNLK